mmetsp:Transcript_93820/g.205343  ORF Transcript_93820/g.205343 Transcript_93820/m.205343 type:complete len:232 (-) Transcript_93820:49-744(-)
MQTLHSFSWQAPKRQKIGDVDGKLVVAFRREEDLDDEAIEETPAPSAMLGQLEDLSAKCQRLTREGNLLAESERFSEALQRWEEALLFAPSEREKGSILEQMAQVLLAMNRDFDACRAAEHAVECRPDWHCAHWTLGRCLLNFGELNKALASLEVAAAFEGNDEELNAELEEARHLVNSATERASNDASKQVIVNGRVVVSRFWETALRVTYDADGRPTTHYPEDGDPEKG